MVQIHPTQTLKPRETSCSHLCLQSRRRSWYLQKAIPITDGTCPVLYDGLMSGPSAVVCYLARTSVMVQSQEILKQGGSFSVLHFISITRAEPWGTIPAFLGCSRLANPWKSPSGSPSVRQAGPAQHSLGVIPRGSCPSDRTRGDGFKLEEGDLD